MGKMKKRGINTSRSAVSGHESGDTLPTNLSLLFDSDPYQYIYINILIYTYLTSKLWVTSLNSAQMS